MVPTKPSARVAEILRRAGHDPAGDFGRDTRRETFRRVLAMGLPSVASFLLLSIYDLIDVFWLAKLGEEPVAAVTVFGAFLWVLSFPNQIIGLGSVAIISRRFGEGDHEGTERGIKSTFLLKFVVGTAMGAVAIAMLPGTLGFLGASPDVRDLGVLYGRIPCAFLGISLASFSVYTALRGVGRPELGMWISVLGTIVNLVLDPLLIFGIGPFPRLGIVGAAIASVAGFAVVTTSGMIALASSYSPVRVRWFSGAPPSLHEMLRMLRIGLPSGFGSLSLALAESMVVKLVATYGTSVVALFGMSHKVLHFGIMVAVGLGLGTSALVGQYLGSRDLHRAWLAAVINMRTSAAILAVFGLGVALLAPHLVRVFFDDPQMIAPGAVYLRLLAIGLPFIGLTIGSEQAYAGAGLNTPPMLMQFVIGWVLVIPLMFVIGRVAGLGPGGMMGGHSLGHALGAMIGIWLVRHGSWLEHRV